MLCFHSSLRGAPLRVPLLTLVLPLALCALGSCAVAPAPVPTESGSCGTSTGEACAAAGLSASGACEGIERRVLVTGISGMIGSFVARAVLENPCAKVYGLVRWRSNLHNLQGVLERITLVYGDLADAFRMRDVIREILPDRVFHFGGQAINNVGFGSPQHTLQVNVIGTLNLLEAVKEVESLRQHTKILFAGSSTEYGKTGDDWDGPIPETAPLLPVSPYGVSKASGEMLVRQYFLAYGVQSVIARIFIHVAPGGTEHLAIQEFSRQLAMIELGLQAPEILHGNLEAQRDMTDVRDSALVYVTLLEKGVPGEAYNVGSSTPYSTQQILDMIIEHSRVPVVSKVDPTRYRHFDEKVLVADISKLQAQTGWVPNPDMRRTVGSVLDYWRREVTLRYKLGDVQAANSS